MLNSRIKRRAVEGARVVARMADIEASIVALKDDDLLDLADIFAGATPSPLQAMAQGEMLKRNLKL